MSGAWISVSERLPDEGTPVLVWVPSWGSQEVAYLDLDMGPHAWRWCDEYLSPDNAPTHWQPLPAAPRGAGAGDGPGTSEGSRALFEQWYRSKYRDDMLGSPHCTTSWFAWLAARGAA